MKFLILAPLGNRQRCRAHRGWHWASFEDLSMLYQSKKWNPLLIAIISESDREGLKKLWNSRFKKHRKSKLSKPKSKLPISEAHSSHRIFSWAFKRLLPNSLISNEIISDIPCKPRQQPLCETECRDNDEAHELGDQDGEGSATDEDSGPESENVGSMHEAVEDEDDEELSATVSTAQGIRARSIHS